MGAFDKIKDKIQTSAEEVLGDVKDKVGEPTGNDDLRAEGKADQASSTVKNTARDTAHDAKDAASDAADDAKDKAGDAADAVKDKASELKDTFTS